YVYERLITLETNAIKMYLREKNLKHFPVDTFPLDIHFDEKMEYLNEKITSCKMISECVDLCYLIDMLKIYSGRDGFIFLNSDQNDQFFEKLAMLKEKILIKLNDKKLIELNRLEKEMLENREHKILQEIYTY